MMNVDAIQEVLQAFKEDKPLEAKGITSKWEDFTGVSLPSLMHWLSSGKLVRVAPPKPREIWKAEYVISGETKLSGDYPSKEVATENWGRSAAFTRAVKFVEVLE